MHKTFSVPGALEHMPAQHTSTAKLVKYHYFFDLVRIIMASSINYTAVLDFWDVWLWIRWWRSIQKRTGERSGWLYELEKCQVL